MMIKAKFWEEKEKIFRSDTKIIFNDESKCIGLIIMLNPGKAESKEEVTKEPRYVETKSDPTLGIIASYLRKAYNKELGGYVEITNLIEQREQKSEKLMIDNDFNISKRFNEIKNIINNLTPKINWIWVAWSKSKKELEPLRELILKEIDDEKIIGCYKNDYYRHPLTINREGLKNDLIEQLRKKL